MKRLYELGIAETPWRAERSQTIPVYYVKNASHSRCFIASTACSGTMREDARLMAASPKLYEAMFNAVKAFDSNVGLANAMEACRAALAEASGESEVTE